MFGKWLFDLFLVISTTRKLCLSSDIILHLCFSPLEMYFFFKGLKGPTTLCAIGPTSEPMGQVRINLLPSCPTTYKVLKGSYHVCSIVYPRQMSLVFCFIRSVLFIFFFWWCYASFSVLIRRNIPQWIKHARYYMIASFNELVLDDMYFY